jgi:hypothetical protein
MAEPQPSSGPEAGSTDVITEVPNFPDSAPASTGPEFVAPPAPAETDAARSDRVASAEAAVAAANGAAPATESGPVQPPQLDGQGYNAGADGYTGGGMSGEAKTRAADAYAASQGLPTSADRAAAQAEAAEPTGVWGRLKRVFRGR